MRLPPSLGFAGKGDTASAAAFARWSLAWVNTVLGNLKPSMAGMCVDHAKHAVRDLAEFAYRFYRRFDLRPC